MVAQGVLAAMSETMEQSMGFIDLSEQCIKAFEKISAESPRAVLQSGALLMQLNMIDFFDYSTQTKILTTLFNVSSRSECEADFQAHILPLLPNLCNMLNCGVQSDQDRTKIERLSTIIARISDSFTVFHTPTEQFEMVGELFDKLSNASVHESIVDNLRTFSNYVLAITSESQKDDAQISTHQGGSKTFTDTTISNFLRVLKFSCMYSQQVFMQLILSGIFEIIEIILRLGAGEEHSSLITDLLAFLNSLLPNTTGEATQDIVIGTGQKLIYSDDPQSGYQRFVKQREGLENSKLEFLCNQEKPLHNQLAKVILPMVFKTYGQNISSDFRTLCLNSIEKTLLVIPDNLLAESLDPNSFTRFLQIILRTHQPQQVLCCLKMVQKLFESKLDLSIYFLRHGIRENILDYTKPETIETLNSFVAPKAVKVVDQGAGGMKHMFLSMATAQERDRLHARVDQIKALMGQVTGAKREEVKKQLALYEDHLKTLDLKTQEFKSQQPEASEEPKPTHMYGTKICELAQSLREKYFDNDQFWSGIKKSNPKMLEYMTKLKSLTKTLHAEAQEVIFDPDVACKNVKELALVLTSSFGLTSFEFEHSGLLRAIQIYLTMPASMAQSQNFDENEESKKQNDQPDEISKREAKCLILRLRYFAHGMLVKTNDKIPFKCLIQQCHEQLTLAEPHIFKDTKQDYQGQVEALRQLCRNVVINLVYEPESQGQSGVLDQPDFKKAKSMPFSQLQAQQQKSLLYLKRHALYEELKQIPLNIQQCDNIWLLEDFLLKKVRTKQDVLRLVEQTRKPQMLMKGAQSGQSKKDHDSMSISQKKLFEALQSQILNFLDDCENEQVFRDRSQEQVEEAIKTIAEADCETPVSFFRLLQEMIASYIRETHMEEGEEIEGSGDDDMEHDIDDASKDYFLAHMIDAKTSSFCEMIEQIKDKVSTDKKEPGSKVEEIKEPVSQPKLQNEDSRIPSQLNGDSDEVFGEEDVEMTDEQQQLKSSQQSIEMEDQSQKGQSLLIDQDKPIHLQQQKSAEFEVEELLKLNNDQDIEVQFFYNKKRLDLNTSIYEICKEPIKETPATNIKDLMDSISQGLVPGYRTINFKIKDKIPQKVTRTDSLVEYSKIRERTKSQFVDEMSAQNINSIVQSLLEEQFTIFKNKPEGQTESLDYALKVLKVLHYIYTHAKMLTTQGLNFLLLKSTNLGNNSEAEDYDLLSQLAIEMSPQVFHHAKLDTNLQKAIQDPYQLVSGGISETLRQIFNQCSFLFPFETKQIYFRLVSFIGVDIYRSLHFLKEHMKKNNRLPGAKQGAIFNDREEKMPRIGKQKVKVNRDRLLTECAAIMKIIQKRTLLEIEYVGEEGTGLGPTLEFYTILSQTLRSDTSLWRSKTPDGSLYPKPMSPKVEQKPIIEKFHLMGVFVAKSLCDNRLIDLPINSLMWDLLMGKKKNLFDLKKLDETLFNLISELQIMANRKQEIDDMQIDAEMRTRLLAQVKSTKGATVEDYCLYFYDPADETIELIKDGADTAVTLHNLQQYIDLVLDSAFNYSVYLQIYAFKKGFSQVLPIETLRIFQTDSEVQNLICGVLGDESEWSSVEKLQEVVVTAHGYHQCSRPFKDFLRYLTELKPEQRPKFLRFITGSPRLPIGGFSGLDPHLTVVLKKPLNSADSPDCILPSVMTCQNYVKMPEYSTYEALRDKFNMAIEEGVGHFSLS